MTLYYRTYSWGTTNPKMTKEEVEFLTHLTEKKKKVKEGDYNAKVDADAKDLNVMMVARRPGTRSTHTARTRRPTGYRKQQPRKTLKIIPAKRI